MPTSWLCGTEVVDTSRDYIHGLTRSVPEILASREVQRAILYCLPTLVAVSLVRSTVKTVRLTVSTVGSQILFGHFSRENVAIKATGMDLGGFFAKMVNYQ